MKCLENLKIRGTRVRTKGTKRGDAGLGYELNSKSTFPKLKMLLARMTEAPWLCCEVPLATLGHPWQMRFLPLSRREAVIEAQMDRWLARSDWTHPNEYHPKGPSRLGWNIDFRLAAFQKEKRQVKPAPWLA